ncbi:MAG TPA: hypothetical protein PKY30_20045 [Myxococcota bacterium]|nr:hypothetical protein [Myxococcota bacterium]
MEKDYAAEVMLAGLTPLIPVPLLDDYAERQVLRGIYRRLAQAHAVALTDEALEMLVEDRSSTLLGCLALAIKWPLKKLFRTVLYFLTIKDVVDAVARNSHRVAIVKQAFAEGHLPERVQEVRAAMDAVLDRTDYSPVTRFLLRRERLPTEAWLEPQGALHHTIAFVHRHGGGGLILRGYRKKIGGQE